MKKLLLILTFVFSTLILSAQKQSNYEKYWQAREDSINKSQTTVADKPVEYDDLYYQPSKDAPKIKRHKRADVDAIVDTLVKENPDIRVNYYYNYDPYFYSYNIGRFYHGGFSYWLYSDFTGYRNDFWMMDANDWYWEMRFMGYPYWNYYPYYNGFYGYNYWNPWRNYNHYGFGYGYGYNNNWNHNNWYSHNHNHNQSFGGGNYQRPEYGRRERSSTLSNTSNRIAPHTRNVSPQNRASYQENRRTYNPSYNQPRMNTRSQYNNSRVGDVSNRRAETRTPSSTQTRTYSRPNTQRSESRQYTAPTRSYNESRSYNNSGQGSFNSGADRRSSSSSSYSGGSNFSSGSRNSGSSSSSYSSGSSSSSGSRSSGNGGGGSVSGRR